MSYGHDVQFYGWPIPCDYLPFILCRAWESVQGLLSSIVLTSGSGKSTLAVFMWIINSKIQTQTKGEEKKK